MNKKRTVALRSILIMLAFVIGCAEAYVNMSMSTIGTRLQVQ